MLQSLPVPMLQPPAVPAVDVMKNKRWWWWWWCLGLGKSESRLRPANIPISARMHTYIRVLAPFLTSDQTSNNRSFLAFLGVPWPGLFLPRAEFDLSSQGDNRLHIRLVLLYTTRIQIYLFLRFVLRLVILRGTQ